MHVLGVLDVVTAPVLGMYTGHTGNQAVLERLNNQWADASGVLFSSDNCGFSEHYKAFTQKIQQLDKIAQDAISAATTALYHQDRFVLIDNQEMLENIPSCMHIPILTMPRVRQLFNDGMIYGWGVDPSKLPEEDVAGRLCDNGTEWFNHPDPAKQNQKFIQATWVSTDPNYSFEEVSMIRRSREYVDAWLDEQMGPEGEHLDLTDLPNRMGKIK